jgi:hypothetical protein
VIFGAVQGDQHMIAKPAKVLQAAGTLQYHLGEDRMEGFCQISGQLAGRGVDG